MALIKVVTEEERLALLVTIEELTAKIEKVRPSKK